MSDLDEEAEKRYWSGYLKAQTQPIEKTIKDLEAARAHLQRIDDLIKELESIVVEKLGAEQAEKVLRPLREERAELARKRDEKSAELLAKKRAVMGKGSDTPT